MSPRAQSKKQQAHAAATHERTPFPHWPHPTAAEAEQVCALLAGVHGMPDRPKVLVDTPDAAAGCGNVPSVLDALVRTILSANTTSKNSTAAKVSMDEVYGRANYRAVLDGGAAKLEDTIRSGGLARNKSAAIVNLLRRLEQRNVDELGLEPGQGELSLDWLRRVSDDDAMNELISYDSVGIKTASCVLLFCLGRDSFAVDTHVWRITQSLGWLPPNGSTYSRTDDGDGKVSLTKKVKHTSNPPSRDQTFYHLDHRVPAHLKYPLHSLLVRHGRGCVRCAANGVTTQDFVDECPIEHLVRRKKGKYTHQKKQVKSEPGDAAAPAAAAAVVGHVVAAGKGVKFEPLEDALQEEEEEEEEATTKTTKARVLADLGSRKRTAVHLEDEAGQPRVDDDDAVGAPSAERGRRVANKRRQASKREEQQEEEEEEGEGQAAGRTRRHRTRASAVAAANAIKHESAAAEAADRHLGHTDEDDEDEGEEDSDLTDLEDDDDDVEEEEEEKKKKTGRGRASATARQRTPRESTRRATPRGGTQPALPLRATSRLTSSKPATARRRTRASKGTTTTTTTTTSARPASGAASVGRDEAEMAGQVYATMHGMDV